MKYKGQKLELCVLQVLKCVYACVGGLCNFPVYKNVKCTYFTSVRQIHTEEGKYANIQGGAKDI